MSLIFSLSRKMRNLANRLDHFALKKELASPQKNEKSLEEYVTKAPSAQNAIDAIPGWSTALPESAGVTAGIATFYHDPRIAWAVEKFGAIKGKRVLELGPLEASHTFQLSQYGAESITSIEANKLAFFRCLVVKEILDIKNAKFLLGDCEKYLETTTEKYDFIVASGILYHMQDPVRLLELLAERTDSFFLWTHYFSSEAMPDDDPRGSAFIGDIQIRDSHGVKVRLHQRSYYGAWKNKAFCGGMHDLHRWIERDDILALIRALGFDDVSVAHDQPDHPNGPSFSIFARRTPVEPETHAGDAII